MLRIKKPEFRLDDLKRILSNGFATFLMEFSLPAVTFSFNIAIMRTMGTLGVTAYSIVGYVCAIINMVLIGVTQGAQPLMSFYHGKEDKKAFYHSYRLGVKTNIILPVVLVALCLVFSEGIVSLFRGGNPELTALTSSMLRLYPMAHIAIGITLMNILYLMNAGFCGSPSRVWGRYVLMAYQFARSVGSPPRVWGRWSQAASSLSILRFTPTRVGQI